MIQVSKEKYMQLKEIILYLFGISFFTNFDIAKIILQIMIVFLLIDIFYFKDKLECGNEKIKKFILFLVVGGIIWNFCADFNYKAARAYLKINRYCIIVFYLYSLIKYKKEILRNFMSSLLISYLFLFAQGIKFYMIHKHLSYYRFDSFEGVMEVAVLISVIGAFSFGQIIERKEIKVKLIGVLIFLISCFLLIITQTRASLLAMIGAISIIIILSKNLKIIIGSFLIGILSISLFFQTPQAERFRTNLFNIKVTTDNMSNGLRVEMWKNAIWRFKQHPIMGSGTKQDEKLFKEYIENLPSENKIQKIYKDELETNFNDAHSMYLNSLTDNGVFSLVQFGFILLFLPYTLIVNKKYKYRISLLGGLFAYCIFGVVWPLWRHGWNPMLLWLIVSLTCVSCFEKEIG